MAPLAQFWWLRKHVEPKCHTPAYLRTWGSSEHRWLLGMIADDAKDYRTACWWTRGLAGKELWRRLDPLRAGAANRADLIPVRPKLVAAVRFFGRYRTGWIRDGVLLSVG